MLKDFDRYFPSKMNFVGNDQSLQEFYSITNQSIPIPLENIRVLIASGIERNQKETSGFLIFSGGKERIK